MLNDLPNDKALELAELLSLKIAEFSTKNKIENYDIIIAVESVLFSWAKIIMGKGLFKEYLFHLERFIEKEKSGNAKSKN